MSQDGGSFLLRQRVLSVGSERELDDLAAARSGTSADLQALHQVKETMEDDHDNNSYLDMYRPGTAKPPHHHRTDDGEEDSTHRPSQADRDVKHRAAAKVGAQRAPEHKNTQNMNQWSVDASDNSESGPTIGSPVKLKESLPEVEIVKAGASKGGYSEEAGVSEGVSRGPRYSSHRSYNEMLDNMSVQDPFNTDYQSSGKSKSKIPKKKKSISQDQSSDSIPMGRVSKQFTKEPKKLRKKHRHRHHHQGSESLNSTATYVIEPGVVNDGYEDSGSSTRKGSKGVVDDHVSNATYTLSEGEPESQGLKESFNKLMRKLNTVKVPSGPAETGSHLNQRAVSSFISRKIKQRECKKFAKDKNSKMNSCLCGRPIQWHEDRGIHIDLKKHEIWNMKTHTDTMPCDSFGEILFRGFGHDVSNSPYVRVDPICDLNNIWTILTDLWDLPIPKLIISVTGGAKRFDLKPRLRRLLKEGLCHAAASTGAWMITGGTSAGVMEFVGEAVQDYTAAIGNPEHNKVVALGIATWGVVANNFALDGEGDEGLFPATYAVEDVEATGSGSTSLDHNHTHFILVDDGTSGKYGAEIKFRTKLESFISRKVETGVSESQSVNVPNVLIVVEGGLNTMRTVSESIQRNTPVVVIEGSGRAAEYIALGYKLTKSKDEEKSSFPRDFNAIMTEKARKMFVWKSTDSEVDKKIQECLLNLRDCLENRRLINVYNLENAASIRDIDRAILYALLKANRSNANSQLALALAWNRCDIARQEIFTPSNRKYWQKINLYDAMVTALVQDRTDFVQLFIDNGLDIKRFLTVKTLWNLYANMINDMGDTQAELIRNLLAYQRQTWAAYLCCQGAARWQYCPDLLQFIGKIIMYLLQDQAMLLYNDKKYLVDVTRPSMSWLGDPGTIKPLMKRITQDGLQMQREAEGHISHRSKLKVRETFEFTNPEKHLFLWAILFNRRQMAHLFWKLGKDHLTSGLVASSLLKTMSDVAEDDEELEMSADLLDHAVHFEKQSFDVLSECYGRDKRHTHTLLVCEQLQWGKTTLFKLADAHTLMDFAEHSACQTKLNDIWKGRMALYTPEWKIIITILLPILLPFIKFTSNNSIVDMLEGNDSDDEELMDDSQSPGHTPGHTAESPSKANQVEPGTDDAEYTPAKSRRKRKQKKRKLYTVNLMDFSRSSINIFTAIFYFYAAPVTKFYCNVGSYIGFLCIFSYFVLIDLRPSTEADSPSVYEMVTWVWLVTMLLEECRQIFIRDQRSVRYKIQNWFSNIWNRFDLLIYTLFIISIVLRYNLFTSSFVWARMSYSITLAFYYLRFMQFFFAAKNMGPKVIMIRKMLTDLLFFFFILLVFVLSFGVAYHTNLYPNHIPSYKILINVLYLPYWQMYGELFLERVQGEDDPSSCTRNETLWRADLAPRCPEPNALVSILLAVYMILTNILLVNLLIAMFSYTFQTVQDNSMKIWRYYRLSLVFEYFDRPTLVPPIIIINHIYRLFMWGVNHCCRSCKRSNAFSESGPTTLGGKIEERLNEKEYARLQIFEKVAMENYLSRSMIRRREQLDNRVASTAERIENVMHELEMIRETVSQSGQQSLTEEQMQQLATLDTMTAPRPATGETAYVRQCVDDLSEQVGQNTMKLSQMMHMMELLVDGQTRGEGGRRSREGHTSRSHGSLHGLTISEVTHGDEEEDA
ncbi:transient receptor potential cation channel subfamily M member 2-like isoform X1 [Haliotis rufescens]|uniref:transient receptor potential cation channel subfamily M member 2-like isoform X1 n=1 Tax=Haliotis rufescens TaxID=6454 RepID=UPI00201F78AC|nr:transient receptor potential cation channel subfamily M member 2-like isoform X1 [Haliotis rufescens]